MVANCFIRIGVLGLAVTLCVSAAEKPSPFGTRTTTSGSKDRAKPASGAPGSSEQGEGVACFYGRKLTGELNAAHREFPIGALVRVTNVANHRTVTVTITSHGLSAEDKVIMVNRDAAEQLDFVSAGTAPVRLELVSKGGAQASKLSSDNP